MGVNKALENVTFRGALESVMEAVVLCGLQATGKSTFCKERFYGTHVRLNLDMLRTRHREGILLHACIEAKQPFVIDNTNPTRAERALYIAAAKAAGFRIVGYNFESKIGDALQRNAERIGDRRVREAGIRATAARLELPAMIEGFDSMFYVRLTETGFEIQEWRDEV
jgi:predicted kinase